MFHEEQTGELTGLVPALYQAIAAAAGDGVLASGICSDTSREAHFARLLQGDFDVFMFGIHSCMENELYEPNSKSSMAHTNTPYGFSGLNILSTPFYFDCAAHYRMKHIQECQDLNVCVDTNQHTSVEKLRTMSPRRRTVLYNDTIRAFQEDFQTGNAMCWRVSALC